MRKIFLVVTIIGFMCFSMLPVFAANQSLQIIYEPNTANFSSGQKNVVTTILQSRGKIAGVTLIFQTTGGVKIVDTSDALDQQNNSITQIKYIKQDKTDHGLKLTVLVLKATSDLPSVIKIPVVVSGNAAGNLMVDMKKSQVIDDQGNSFSLSSSKASYITFSDNVKNSIPPSSTLSKNSVSVDFRMKFQGIDPSKVKTKTISGVKVQLLQESKEKTKKSLPQFMDVTLADDGLWHGKLTFSGVDKKQSYALLIKGPKHLQKRVCDSTPQEEKEGSYDCTGGKITFDESEVAIDTSNITLMVGDIGIQDAILNSYDLSVIQNAMKKTTNVLDGDVNFDGKVDKTDYQLMLNSLSWTSGQDQI